MKNIITINRLTDNARRIYELPEDAAVTKGTLVKVATRYGGEALLGIAATDNILMDEDQIKAVRVTLGMCESGNFVKVLAVYDEPKELKYPTEADKPEDDEPEEAEEDQ